MREIVFDTETTGLDPRGGDRIVEIGGIELLNHIPTGRSFHRYLNPERSVPVEAARVHGLDEAFLKDKPLFAAIVDEMLEFFADAQLIAHNAMFDLGFLNAELARVNRPPLAVDLDGWAELLGDEQAARFIGGIQPRAGAWRSMAAMAGSWSLHGFGMFSVIEKASGRWIGRLGPWRPEGWPGDEIAWGLVRPAWGRGFAAEGAAAAIDWAVGTLGWSKFIHCIDPANQPSIRLAGRIGSRRLGPGRLPAPFADALIEIWGQSADEWRARRSPGEG